MFHRGSLENSSFFVIVFRWVLGKLGRFLKFSEGHIWSRKLPPVSLLFRLKNQMKQLSPPADGCIEGEAVACLKAAWSGVTFQLLFPVASGIAWNTRNFGAASFPSSWS